MKNKTKFIFSCQQCGQQYSKWVGRCTECGEWNSVVEERESSSAPSSNSRPSQPSGSPLPISEILASDYPRYVSDLPELDNVLGGGLVPGSVVLLGGEPGVGKSTLLLQAADQFGRSGKTVLYVSGEESGSQVALRASRLGVKTEKVLFVSETHLENILAHIDKTQPQILILDSVQTVHSSEMESQPGSVGQLRECSNAIIATCKEKNLAAFLVGHVTKEGAIAGPKVLEHMVDVVLHFEGTSSQNFRILRSNKNRFGSTHEIGVFEMASTGMRQVANPSELFLSERPKTIPGSVIVASVEGTRPILVEVQALVSHSALAMPRRTAIGIDQNRLCLLVAILEKRSGFRLYDQDVYLNIAGGLRILETAVDLGVMAALISSETGKSISPQAVFFGEVGLGGEVRTVPKAAIRLKEAQRIGLKQTYVPAKVAKEVSKDFPQMEIIAIDHVKQLSDKL
ncbi:MAG: DNA repair protein RadA [Proteobacteria bacterium]|nr:DNA repair protein RadA [Pseudomonadota bacterium]